MGKWLLLLLSSSSFLQFPDWNKERDLIPYGEGCTNQNYLLTREEGSYFVRFGSLAKEHLGLSIPKEREIIEKVSELGLSPPLLFSNDETLVFPFIPSRPLNLHKKEELERAISLLKRLHESSITFSRTTTPEDLILAYLEKIDELHLTLTPDQAAIVAARPHPQLGTLTPCHLDVKGINYLDDGERLWLIDWEYGAMSDPLADLASLGPGDGFTPEELDQALSLYTPNPSEELQARFRDLCYLSNMRAALWCLIMAKVSPLDHPYRPWAEELFADLLIYRPFIGTMDEGKMPIKGR